MFFWHISGATKETIDRVSSYSWKSSSGIFILGSFSGFYDGSTNHIQGNFDNMMFYVLCLATRDYFSTALTRDGHD